MQEKMKRILTENQDFWQRLLGRELYGGLLEDICGKIIIAQADCVRKTEIYIQNLKFHTSEKVLKTETWISNEIFASFYQIVIDAYLQHSNINLNAFSHLKNRNMILKQLLYSSIEKIPQRVLIYDMYQCKNEGKLLGENRAEEYEYYCQNMLSDKDYVYNLCSVYFEMTRMLIVRMTYTIDFFTEMLHNIDASRLEISRCICEGEEFHFITALKVTGADSHQKGKKTVECALDTGRKIVYKPHTMRKEAAYHKLYTHFCVHTGNKMIPYPVIDCGNYGVARFLPDSPCVDSGQVQEYFRCMGIHLFLCYLLHAGDMHQENIVATVEMPILVDAETIPGIQGKCHVNSAKDKINDRLSWNVLHTGILPYPVWRDNRRGVILNALHKEEEIYSTMKFPVVKNEKTSEMRIDYKYVKITDRDSLPTYKGKRTGAEKYINEVSEGFTSAYRFYLLNKTEIEQMIEPFWQFETRYLVRHTQQYVMYLSSALHPMFMRTIEEHMLMLQVLQKKRCDTSVIKKELSALLNMDIPLLFCKADEYVEQYKNSAYETHKHLIEKFGLDDMKEQIELIKLSMQMMDANRLQNKYFISEANTNIVESCLDRKKLEQALRNILSLIEEKATVYEGDICWYSLKLEGENLWSIQPVEMGLYDGICGIAVYVALMRKIGYLQKAGIYKLTVNKVCGYIDTEAFQSERKTGLYVGAGTFIYTYLMLYYIEGDVRYLSYAQKVAKRISNIYDFDQEYDLLSGNAGAITALAKLYKVTQNRAELEQAVEIGDWLVEKVLRIDCGECIITLGGMAHGYSGFIIAYSQLLKYTHNQKYCEIIDILLKYENLSYSEEKGNWRDLRNSGNEVYANAWCHGAAGILLSRLGLMELAEYRDNNIVKRNIENAAKVLFEQSYRSGLCLCHGMAGNYLIMKEYQKHYRLTTEQKKIMTVVGSRLVNVILEGRMLPQDRYVMGFMTGLSGIGVCLGEMMTENNNISHYMTEKGQNDNNL